MDIQQRQTKEFLIKDGKDVARYLIYFSKNKQKWLNAEVNIANISGVVLYRKHRAACDRCFAMQEKYGIDIVKYLKFFSSKFNINDNNIDRIADFQVFVWYANELQILAKYEKVYGYILKSVDNIVQACIDENYTSAKEYIKHLISENKLAEQYISGKISQYYLAGIRNLPKIVKAMDEINKDTLQEVIDQQDKLYSDMQDAFTHFKMSRISIISFTNDKLTERLKVLSKTTNNKK